MSLMNCKSCNGVYLSKQTDGSLYFHQCPASVPPAQARNENLPSTVSASAGQVISAGLGNQPSLVAIQLSGGGSITPAAAP